MPNARVFLAALIGAALSSPAWSAPPSCDMPGSFLQINPGGARKVLTSPDALVFSATMQVDADGGPHAYSAKDPDGKLCNPKIHPENKGKDPITLGCAMDSICDGASVTLPSKEVLGTASCTALSQAFRLIRDAHWQPPAGYVLSPIGIEMRKTNLPCLDADEAYIVSPSSTTSGAGSGKACDQSNYVDTLVPSIVVPKCWATSYREDPKNKKACASYPAAGVVPGAEVGDLVALRGRRSGIMTYGIIGDLGPNKKLGEASVGLLMKAAGQKDPPTFLHATNLLADLEPFDVLIVKGTRYGKPLTLANKPEMETTAEGAFRQWGGGDLAAAGQRLAACGQVASPAKKAKAP